jgi:hypothetical protein
VGRGGIAPPFMKKQAAPSYRAAAAALAPRRLALALRAKSALACTCALLKKCASYITALSYCMN